MTRYKLETTTSLLPQQQQDRGFRHCVPLLVFTVGPLHSDRLIGLDLFNPDKSVSVSLLNSVCRRRVGNRGSTSDRGSSC